MFSGLKSNYFQRLDIRLTTYSTLILLALSAFLCFFFYFRLQHVLMKQVDKILIDETHELIDDIREHGDIISGCRVFEADIARRKYYPFDFRVLTESGEILYQSKKASRLPFPAIKKIQDFSTFTLSGKRYLCRLYERKFSISGKPDFIAQIATETKQNRELLERFQMNILWAIPIMLLLSIGCGLLASRKPRRIIKDIATVASKITSQNLKERLPVSPVRDEVQELSVTINSMIDRLEKSFNEVKQFTSDVSHELRNPLFALKGNMEVTLSLQRDSLEYRDTLAECLDRINSLIKIVNDLFLISRFETKKINLDLNYLNMGEVVRDIFDFFQPMAQEKKIRFKVTRCDDVVLLADKTRILQLISNLIDNAVKFTPESGEILLSLTKENRGARLSVRDTGIGIPEAEIPKIFDRFYQVDEARSGSARGTGLGLQICKRIVEAHGGSIAVQKNPDRGITFMVLLPVNE
ncbi:MAG: ATP-binding protein [Pseudomonadota bacterium]